MKMADYNIEDFASDNRFIRWVLFPNDQDNAYWENWTKKHQSKEPLINSAKQVVRSFQVEEKEIPDSEIEMGFEKLLSFSKQNTLILTKQSKFKSRTLLRIAAIFIGLMALGSVITLISNVWNQNKEFSNYGEIKRIELPDKSIVYLNANSSITYLPDWENKEKREVWIEGEAFFDVRKTPFNSRFVVYTNDLKIEVTGTKFNVRNRNNNTSVVLNQGVVQIKYTKESYTNAVYMKPGDFFQFSKESQTEVFKKVEPGIYSSWTDKILIFNDITLQEIAQRIEETYGLKTIIADKTLATRKMNGKVPADNLEVLLKTVGKTFGIQVRLKDQVIYFKPSR